MDPAQLTQVSANLGVAGFALYIMWKMYEKLTLRMKEKDEELLREIDKRDARIDAERKEFRLYAEKVQDTTMVQLSKNTQVLEKSIIIMDKILDNTKSQ